MSCFLPLAPLAYHIGWQWLAGLVLKAGEM
jgi:hypothetical protein